MSNKPNPARPAQAAAEVLRDLFAFAGVGLIATGCWMVYPPAAFIVPGALLFGLGVWRPKP